MKKIGMAICGMLMFLPICMMAQTVDYSVVNVSEEGGLELVKITKEADYVCMPEVKRNSKRVIWNTNKVIDISPDGQKIAYISFRNNSTNIFIKELDKLGLSAQRTNRQSIIDFTFSPDGKSLLFTESRGKQNQVFQTSAESGFVCRQITSGNIDYSPIYSSDLKRVFFARQENKGVGIWAYDLENNYLATYSQGYNPYPMKNESAFICVRDNSQGGSEIWKVNYDNSTEECIVSHSQHNFTSPVISPDGEWLLFVGSTKIDVTESKSYYNTDIFVARLDGSDFMQLTYHAADDLSPVWSSDGKYIYFVSQRGSADAIANIWRMTFNK